MISDLSAWATTVKPGWQRELRAQVPLLERVAYLDTGAHAPLVAGVHQVFVCAIEREGTSGLAGRQARDALTAEQEFVRARLAAFLGAPSANQIGLTSSTSMALRFAANSLTWRAGDVLITSSLEHAGTRKLRDGLVNRLGVRSKTVAAGSGDGPLMAALEAALAGEPRARLVILSQVVSQDGRRLPVAAATRLAHAFGVPVLVDGAQAPGQVPVDLAAIGCDFYAGSSHKWLLCPPGLGYLYVAASRLPAFDPDFVLAPPEEAGASVKEATVRHYLEITSPVVAPLAALGAALDRLERIGLPEIERYVGGLSMYLRGRLSDLPGVRVLTPTGPGESSGITSFTLPRTGLTEVQRVVTALAEERSVIVKAQPEQPAVRVSVAAFNTTGDLERLLEGLAALI